MVLADVDASALERAAAEVGDRGAEVTTAVTDVSDPDAVDALRVRAVERFGAVHVVCNNAGVVTLAPLWEQTLDDWRWVIGVDLWGVINGVRSFLPLLLEQGEPAHIVNTASIAGLVPSPAIAPYNVARLGSSRCPKRSTWSCARPARRSACPCCAPASCPPGSPASGRNRPGGPTGPLDIPTQAELPPTALHARADRRRRRRRDPRRPVLDHHPRRLGRRDRPTRRRHDRRRPARRTRRLLSRRETELSHDRHPAARDRGREGRLARHPLRLRCPPPAARVPPGARRAARAQPVLLEHVRARSASGW